MNSKWFENLIVYLNSNYKIVPIDYFEDQKNYVENSSLCAITFDDGDISVYEEVLPIIKKYNVPVALFISPRSVRERFNFWFQEVSGYDNSQMVDILIRELNIKVQDKSSLNYISILKTLSISKINEMIELYQKETHAPSKAFRNIGIQELMELRQSGLITFGAHTLYHPILKNENDDRVEYEISQSILELSELLGEQVRFFAYPNGTPDIDFGQREIKILKKNNVSIAFSTEPQFVNKHSKKLMFPRIGITKGSIFFIRVRLFLGPLYSRIKSVLIMQTEQSQRKMVNRQAVMNQ